MSRSGLAQPGCGDDDSQHVQELYELVDLVDSLRSKSIPFERMIDRPPGGRLGRPGPRMPIRTSIPVTQMHRVTRPEPSP